MGNSAGGGTCSRCEAFVQLVWPPARSAARSVGAVRGGFRRCFRWRGCSRLRPVTTRWLRRRLRWCRPRRRRRRRPRSGAAHGPAWRTKAAGERPAPPKEGRGYRHCCRRKRAAWRAGVHGGAVRRRKSGTAVQRRPRPRARAPRGRAGGADA